MSLTPMLIAKNTVPSSLRKPIANSRSLPESYVANSYPKLKHAVALKPAEAKAVAIVAQGRFCPMPQEAEDAKLTGSTRSLERRLLALNIGGSKLALRSSAA